jgi:hypothetical protein
MRFLLLFLGLLTTTHAQDWLSTWNKIVTPLSDQDKLYYHAADYFETLQLWTKKGQLSEQDRIILANVGNASKFRSLRTEVVGLEPRRLVPSTDEPWTYWPIPKPSNLRARYRLVVQLHASIVVAQLKPYERISAVVPGAFNGDRNSFVSHTYIIEDVEMTSLYQELHAKWVKSATLEK